MVSDDFVYFERLDSEAVRCVHRAAPGAVAFGWLHHGGPHACDAANHGGQCPYEAGVYDQWQPYESRCENPGCCTDEVANAERDERRSAITEAKARGEYVPDFAEVQAWLNVDFTKD